MQDTPYRVVFLADTCYLQDHNWKTALEIGKEENGLYMLTNTSSKSLAATVIVTMSQPSAPDPFIAHVSSLDVWHARMGHISSSMLHHLPFKFNSPTALDVCDSCHFAKQCRMSFSHSQTTSKDLFDLVHADVWGPYRVKTHGSCNMFLTLVDDKSSCTWIYLLPDKSVVSQILKEFILLIKNQFTKTVKVLRTDNGSEFMNRTLASFLAELGIIHQCSCVYTPQQNGLVERNAIYLIVRGHCVFMLIFPLHFGVTAFLLQHI